MPSPDVVIVGAGIAGSALATALARRGKQVLLLERSEAYTDRVRGEYIQPWGVAELRKLGLEKTLLSRSGTYHKRLIPYDETLASEEAESSAVALDKILPGVPGTIGISHPLACEVLSEEAERAGATVLRGVSNLSVEVGDAPSLTYHWHGIDFGSKPRLVVGADGRDSTVRRLAGIQLNQHKPRLLGAGLRVADLDWPQDVVTIGTEGDCVFFVLPQGVAEGRLYLMFPPNLRSRFTGRTSAADFLQTFTFDCIPNSERIRCSRPAGPCATYPMNDTWAEESVIPGVVLVGDAAGYSDPHIGQGLSVGLRDARLLSEVLLATNTWDEHSLTPYVEERAERMRRLRFCNLVATTLRGEFGEKARRRRIEARKRMQKEPELGLWRVAAFAGPETVPASAFDATIPGRLFKE